MKNKHFPLSMLAVLAVFAMLGCPGGDDVIDDIIPPNTVTINFVAYDGATPLSFTIGENEALGQSRYVQVQQLQTRTDFIFNAWSLSKGGAPETVNADSKWAADAAYHGLWKVSVTFNPNYTDAEPLELTLDVDEALGATRLAQVTALETRADYEFKGWALSADGDPEAVTATSKWAAQATYYALWEEIVAYGQPITLTYHLNSFPATEPVPFSAQSGIAIGAEALPTLTPTDTAYTFLGWSTTTDGAVITASAVFNSNTDLYARYERSIIITYHLNGFPAAETPAPYAVTSGQPIGNDALPVLTSTNPDYTHLGWSETPDGETITASAVFTVDTDLYARHTTDVVITLTYDLNDFPVVPTEGIGYSAPNGTGRTSNETLVANQVVLYPFAPANKPVSGPVGTAGGLPVLATKVPGYTWLGWSTTPDGPVVPPSTVFTVDTTLYARYNFNPPSFTPPASLNFDIPYDMHPLRTNISNDWIRGADISNCFEIEQYGGQYKNIDGMTDDIMKILVDNGVNYVRLRLWVDPEAMQNHYPGDGNNKMAVTKVIAARAKAAGMKFLLDYHYSDYWADPGQQFVPLSWTATSKADLYDQLEIYTTETIEEFIAAGAKPDMVQLGNEIRPGILNARRSGNSGATLSGWGDFSMALSRAASATRAIDPSIKIMIQFDAGGDSGILSTYGNFTRRIDNGAVASNTEVDYDVVGLSWYTYWSSHQSLSNLYTNIQNFRTRFGKEVVVCESGFGFNFGSDVDYPPGAWKVKLPQGFAENLSNVYGIKNQNMESLGAARLTANTQRFVADSGIPYTLSSFAGNAENQARGYRALMDAVAAAGGAGVMWWGADWFAPVMGLNSNVENSALFDESGKALPVIRVLGGIKGPDQAKPGKVTGLTATLSGGTNATLTWDTVNTAITNRYKVERATSANGPWTEVADNLTSVGNGDNQRTQTYTDSGLAEGTTFYYRVSAYNTNGWGNPSDEKSVTITSAPTTITVTVTGTTADSVSLSWNSLTGATVYEVSRATASAGPWTTLSSTVAVTTYTDTGLTAGTTYYYRVRSNNGTTWGDYSAAVTATPTVVTPTEYTLAVTVTIDPNAPLESDEVVVFQGGHRGGTNWGNTDNATLKLEKQGNGTWTGTIANISIAEYSTFGYNLYAEKNTVTIGSNGRPTNMSYGVRAARESGNDIPFTHTGGATGVLAYTVTAWVGRPVVVAGNLLRNAGWEDGTGWNYDTSSGVAYQAPWTIVLNNTTNPSSRWLRGDPDTHTGGRVWQDHDAGGTAYWLTNTTAANRVVRLTQSVSATANPENTALSAGMKVTLSVWIRRVSGNQGQKDMALLVGSQKYNVMGDLTTATAWQEISHTFTLVAGDFSGGNLTSVGLEYWANGVSDTKTFVDDFLLVVTP